jgi:hypothetical protein
MSPALEDRALARSSTQHSIIPRVGRYSMLITPEAGALFHAVFHTGAVAAVSPLVR